MSCTGDEPISPELVLVSPELREQALARVRLLPWEAVAVSPPARPQPERPANVTWEVLALFGQLARVATVVVLASVSVTLVLTLVADAMRQ